MQPDVTAPGLWERSPPGDQRQNGPDASFRGSGNIEVVGANKTYQSKKDNRIIVGESDEFKRLRHAIAKAHGDRERAIRNVCHLYGVSRPELLPGAIRAATLALIGNSAA